MMTARLNKLQRRSNDRIRKLVVAAAVVVAAASSVAFPATATAAVVGAYQPAQVQCDRMTNRVDITPSMAIGSSYTRQRVAYRLAIVSRTTGTTLSTPNYNQWFVFDRNAWVYTYLFSESGTTGQWTLDRQVPTWTHTYYPSAGEYSVFTQYIWEAPLNSGIWYDVNGRQYSSASSPWTQTQSYTNHGDWLPSTFCKVKV